VRAPDHFAKQDTHTKSSWRRPRARIISRTDYRGRINRAAAIGKIKKTIPRRNDTRAKPAAARPRGQQTTSSPRCPVSSFSSTDKKVLSRTATAVASPPKLQNDLLWSRRRRRRRTVQKVTWMKRMLRCASADPSESTLPLMIEWSLPKRHRKPAYYLSFNDNLKKASFIRCQSI
jgi:hypothetical protein